MPEQANDWSDSSKVIAASTFGVAVLLCLVYIHTVSPPDVQLALVGTFVPALSAIGAIVASVLVWLKVADTDKKAVEREVLAEDERQKTYTVVDEIHTAVNSTASKLAIIAEETKARNIALEKQVEKLVGKIVAMEQGANPSEARTELIKETTTVEPTVELTPNGKKEAESVIGDIAKEVEVIKGSADTIKEIHKSSSE